MTKQHTQPRRNKRDQKLTQRHLREEVLQLFNLGLIGVKEAMSQLSLSRSSLYRLSKAYEEQGPQAFTHGNQHRAPINKLSEAIRQELKELLSTKYHGFQASLAAEYLHEQEGIKVSKETVRRMIREIDPVEPATKGDGNAHRLRRRRASFGELVQIDGSPHAWFGSDYPNCCLIAFIDDATSMITDAAFFETERSDGYLQLIEHHLRIFGIPVAFYSDRHGIFDPTIKDANGNSGLTQYKRVCNTLGIEAIRAYSPQAKGRIERLFKTLQGRWPKEFKLRGIKTIDAANAVIDEYINRYNKRFALKRDNLPDAHVRIDDTETVKRICAVWNPRRLSKELTCRFNGRRLQVLVKRRLELSYQEVQVIEYRDGHLEVVYEHIVDGRKVMSLLPFALCDVSQVKEFEDFETTKTIDARLDKIRLGEQSRRVNWINRRREAAEKHLNEREKEVQELEKKAMPGDSKLK